MMKVYSQDGKLFTRDNPIFKGVRWSALGDQKWAIVYLRGDDPNRYYDAVKVAVKASKIDLNKDGKPDIQAWVLTPKLSHYTESFPLTTNKTLMRKWIKPFSERVLLDGSPLLRHYDYEINYERGEWRIIRMLLGHTVTMEYEAAGTEEGALPQLTESDLNALPPENAFLETPVWGIPSGERIPIYLVIQVSPYPVKCGVDLLQRLSVQVRAAEKVIPFEY